MSGRRAGALLALTMLIVVAGAGWGGAPAVAATTLAVEAGHGGVFVPGPPTTPNWFGLLRTGARA